MKLKKSFSIITVITLIIMFTFSAFVFADNPSVAPDPVKPGDTASIIVNDVTPGDKFKVYKMIDIAYDATTNTVNYSFNEDFEDFFTSKGISKVEDFDEDELTSIRADIADYIKTNSITPTISETTVAESATSITFENLAMGGYFILPTKSNDVYQPMFQSVEPTIFNSDDGDYYFLKDNTFNAKLTPATIEKIVDTQNVNYGDTVNYTITVGLPTYMDDAKNKKIVIKDDASNAHIDIKKTSIVAKGDGSTTIDISEYITYTETGTEGNTTVTGFTIDFDKIGTDTKTGYESKELSNFNTLVITYSATVKNDAELGLNTKDDSGKTTYFKNDNVAEFTYSYYPYYSSDPQTVTIKDNAFLNTFGIRVNKLDSKSTTENKIHLQGATFELYSDSDCQTLIRSGVTTAADGIAEFKGLAPGKYYLKETKSPTGYIFPSDPVTEITIATDSTFTTDGYLVKEISNTKGFTLPGTGEKGTKIFIIGGISLVTVAIILLVLSSRYSKKKND